VAAQVTVAMVQLCVSVEVDAAHVPLAHENDVTERD
jgi:hypothetical protein